jgi:hypothetical protein
MVRREPRRMVPPICGGRGGREKKWGVTLTALCGEGSGGERARRCPFGVSMVRREHSAAHLRGKSGKGGLPLRIRRLKGEGEGRGRLCVFVVLNWVGCNLSWLECALVCRRTRCGIVIGTCGVKMLCEGAV